MSTRNQDSISIRSLVEQTLKENFRCDAGVSVFQRDGLRVELYHSVPQHARLASNIHDVPSESQVTSLTDVSESACPAETLPIVERLVATARDAGGKFVVCGFGESRPGFSPLPPRIVHIENSGEPISIYRKIGAAIREITATPGMNCYIMPCLVRSDLPEGQRGKESDVIGVLAIALDFDAEHDPASRHDRIAVYPMSEVETSPGNFQSWWFLDRPYSVSEAKPVIAAHVNTSGSDPMCKSAEHPFRLAGLLNWPTHKKIVRGRSADPVKADLFMPPEEWEANITLDDLRAGIIVKYPTAFSAKREASDTATEIDWDKRFAAFNPLSQSEIVAALDDPKHARDRSVGCWAFINLALRRGYTAGETRDLMLDHSDTLLMGHYRSDRLAEDVTADVQRAITKMTLDGHFGSGILSIKQLKEQGASERELKQAMNEAFAVARYGAQVLIVEIREVIEPDTNLISMPEFHRMFANTYLSNEGDPDRGRPQLLSKSWEKWSERREYLDPGLVFEPNSPPYAPGKLNLWRGFGVEPRPGDWSLLREHIRDVACSGDEKLFDYVIKWMAYAVQHPERPGETAIVMRGKPGAGKGIVARTFGSLFGQHYKPITQREQLLGRFNASLGNTIVVYLDEVLWGGDKQGEGALKALITEHEFMLERKFKDPVRFPNRLHILISSNETWVVPVGQGDRRFLVLDVLETHANKDHHTYWQPLYDQVAPERGAVSEAGRAAMLYDLLNMDLTNFNVRVVPNTAGKVEQKLMKLSGPEAWLLAVLSEGRISSLYEWNNDCLVVPKSVAYGEYRNFVEGRRGEYEAIYLGRWAKRLYEILGVENVRPCKCRFGVGQDQVPAIKFGALSACRTAFERKLDAESGMISWDGQT
jgi:hypothetical protein